jgi:hypothetical protein
MRRLSTDDFVWSIRLGSQLRVLSYEQDYLYEFAYMQNGMRILNRRVITCGKGQCVLCRPEIGQESSFWVIDIADLEKQVSVGKLVLNGIPANWHRLKEV